MAWPIGRRKSGLVVFQADRLANQTGDAKGRTVTPTDPLRLSVAAALAFPDGSMTASGLRRERDRERLIVERIARDVCSGDPS